MCQSWWKCSEEAGSDVNGCFISMLMAAVDTVLIFGSFLLQADLWKARDWNQQHINSPGKRNQREKKLPPSCRSIVLLAPWSRRAEPDGFSTASAACFWTLFGKHPAFFSPPGENILSSFLSSFNFFYRGVLSLSAFLRLFLFVWSEAQVILIHFCWILSLEGSSCSVCSSFISTLLCSVSDTLGLFIITGDLTLIQLNFQQKQTHFRGFPFVSFAKALEPWKHSCSRRQP